jgi:two-component system invasion response regulator UvrY
MKKILLVEDHPIMRLGTRTAIESFLARTEIVEVDNYKKMLAELATRNFDLVVLDVDIPVGKSVRMVEDVKGKWPNVRILIYTSFDENLCALPFIKAGADGFLSKQSNSGELKTAVETIFFQNRLYMSENLREDSFRMFIKSGRQFNEPGDQLTIREREISQLFLAGKGVSEISGLLNLHTSTVGTHRSRILKKMGVENMMDLARKFELLK